MFDKLSVSSKTERILTKSLDEEISVDDANYLMNIKGGDLYPLLATADFLRNEIVGDKVTFINNCNIINHAFKRKSTLSIHCKD